VHVSCMGKTITIDDEAYDLLSSLKQGKRDSFSQVIHRNVHRKANTCGELEAIYDKLPPPEIDVEMAERYLKERGRRSGGRK
jgi:predicted CopG family antitoxin